MQPRRFSYRSILEVLSRHEVESIVVGNEVKAGIGRPKDMAVLPILRQTLAERQRQRTE